MGPRRLNDKRWCRGFTQCCDFDCAGFEQSHSQVLVRGVPPSSHSSGFFLISVLLLLLLLLFIILACCAPLEHHSPFQHSVSADSPYLLQMSSAFLALCLRLPPPPLLLYTKTSLLAGETSPSVYPCSL